AERGARAAVVAAVQADARVIVAVLDVAVDTAVAVVAASAGRAPQPDDSGRRAGDGDEPSSLHPLSLRTRSASVKMVSGPPSAHVRVVVTTTSFADDLLGTEDERADARAPRAVVAACDVLLRARGVAARRVELLAAHFAHAGFGARAASGGLRARRDVDVFGLARVTLAD